ncbi:MAG TPA: MgtC/SapB family protein [Gemmatimonadota bacterium]|nr:MgtC/SapB family protein [Gemmatimonadota bacterium]
MTEFLTLELWVKLVLAIGCGAAIGLEREMRDKPAGLRTHMLICIGSALITMVSLHVAITYSRTQINIADPGRIAAQIVSGIGFLGAGTIIQARGSVHGLTTAATIWVMAGIGLAIGSGAYAPAIATTLILLTVLTLVRWFEARLAKPHHFVYFRVSSRSEAGVLDEINRIAGRQRLDIDDFKLARGGEGLKLEFALTCSPETRNALIEELLEIDAVSDVQVGQ